MSENLPIGLRIQHFYRTVGMDQQTFAQDLGFPVATISNYVTGRTSHPKSDFLEKLCMKYPALNIRWLLTGKGDIWSSSVSGGEKPESEKDKIIRLLEEKIITLSK